MGFAQQQQPAPGFEQGAPAGMAGAAEKIQRGTEGRIHFIRKVYGTMFSALAVACVAGVAGFFSMGLVMALAPVLYVASLVGIISLIFLRRNKTLNWAVLYTWSVVNGLLLGGIMYPSLAAGGDQHIFWMAMGTTIAIFGSLTAYVFATRKDFSFMGGFLSAFAMGMLAVILFDLVLGIPIVNTLLYNVIGLVMIIGFILYDTSNVLLHYEDDEYVAAALELVVDFFYLLWRLLHIFGAGGDD